jgi:transformation/transcription domain-associated protein
MALRHIAGTNMKNKLCDFIPNLIDERFIVGNLRSEPVLFTVTHASMADIIHSIRPLLDLPALMAILKSCSELLADNTIPPNLLAVESKIFVTCLESFHTRLQSEGASISPEMSKRASIFLHAILETLSSRMNATVRITQKLNSLRDGNASDDLKALVSFEQTRIIPTLSHLVVESHEGALGGQLTGKASIQPTDRSADEKFCARAFLIALRSILQCIRFLNGRVPDGDIMGRLFRSVCLVLPILRGDASEAALHKHLVDTFVAMEPHVFQEVWTTNLDFFFKLLIDTPNLVVILQYLFQQQATAYSLTALVMRYMVDNLETLLEGNSTTVAIIIRTLRMTFASVANMDDGLEKILFPHLTTLLVDVFPMAARSQDPRNFLSVPYYLFRSLGSRSQTAKFEQLHKEVYPLLPELLDGVNRALELTDDPVHREQLVEIALTTPARVQHLSPYITQLWRPLVLALGSRSPELLRQGLRTLELAVENLPNVDLLDPNAEPLAKELVLALHRTLKPGAASAETAQAASRILGKIGGRNRRILSLAPTLSYEPSTTPASIPIQFTSHTASLQTYPACEVAVNVLQDIKASVYHESAFNLLRTQVLYNLQKVSLQKSK